MLASWMVENAVQQVYHCDGGGGASGSTWYFHTSCRASSALHYNETFHENAFMPERSIARHYCVAPSIEGWPVCLRTESAVPCSLAELKLSQADGYGLLTCVVLCGWNPMPVSDYLVITPSRIKV